MFKKCRWEYINSKCLRDADVIARCIAISITDDNHYVIL